jgi:heme exporter protein C
LCSTTYWRTETLDSELVPLLRNGVVGIAALAGIAWFLSDEERTVRSARVTGPLALVALAVWLALVVFYAPLEKVQGVVQKIFYVHVPCTPPAYLGFVLTAVAGLGFLRTRRETWDRLALCSAEVGVLFCTLILVSGPLWAKPAWGHWWVWDLRLTATLILWFTYVAYLFLRGLTFGSDTARTFSSIYGIVGTAGIPFNYYAVQIAQGATLHPSNPAEEGLPGAMVVTLLAGMAAFLIVFAYLVARRVEIARLEARAPSSVPAEAL